MQELLYRSDLGDGTYRNPILFADYSDPDVIRSGDMYYMTSSSFNHTPGLPILVSTDLVNWKLVNYAVDNIGEGFERPRHSEGIWAPSIREHNGEYFIFYGMPDEGIFMIKTRNPLGKWSRPHNIFPGKGYIDSCPFWDDDGRAYVVHAFAKSRIGFNSKLAIFEISPDGERKISDDRILFDGTDPSHPVKTIEGPKVYKKDGFYYILAPGGGVHDDGYQTALRSRDINGPYEVKTVMASGGSGVPGPHQGGLVTDVNGNDWFIHFSNRGLYGRITYLEPVSWQYGWPVIGVEKGIAGCGEPVDVYKKPEASISCSTTYLDASDDFIDGKYSISWQWMADHRPDFVKDHEGDGLILNAKNLTDKDEAVLWNCPNILAEKIVCPEFVFETCLDVRNLTEGDRAGVIMTGGVYAALEAVKSENGVSIRRIMSEVSDSGSVSEKREAICDISTEELREDGYEIKICMRFVKPFMAETPLLTFSWAVNGTVKDAGIAFTPGKHTWVGAKTGIYAVAGKRGSGGSALFKYVKVKNKE